MKDLIKRLEKAEAGSRELDALIAATFDVRPDYLKNAKGRLAVYCGDLVWVDDAIAKLSRGCPAVEYAAYTASIDAALALAERVLPGDPDFFPTGPSVGWRINLYRGMVPAPVGGWIANLRRHAKDGVEGSSTSPAIALCIAILKAKEIA